MVDSEGAMSEQDSTHEVAERTGRDGSTTRVEKTTTESSESVKVTTETGPSSDERQKRLDPDGR